MKWSALFPITCLVLGLFVFSPGCGTDVGNAGKPITSESSELAAVVGLQHDEVISSVNDGSDSDASPALALRNREDSSGLADTDPVCTTKADGSVDVTSKRSLAFERDFGRAAQRKVQKDTLDTTLDMNYSVPTGLGVLACRNKRPDLSWIQLAELKTVSRLTKTRSRSVLLKADGSTLNQSELSMSSERSVQFARVSASLENLTVRRTSTLNSSVTLSQQNADTTIARSIQTLDDEPIVLEKTRTRGAGVTRVEIVSGAVASTHQDAKTVILRYKNLILNVGSSCHPSSGSIEGQVFASSNAPEAESTFSVIFDSEGATLIKTDGSEEDIELESCQI